MEEQELVELCKAKPHKTFLSFPWVFWTAETYSFGKYIRGYGHYPRFLPLCVYTDHGPGRHDYMFKHDLESGAPCQLFHAPVSAKLWREVSDKPCHVFYSPFVFYRRKNRIERSPDARGTIAFPAHTTEAIDDVSNIEIYIKQLLELPEEFQPVSVCLHMHDINKGQHKVFLKHKIPVYTAGNSNDDRFCERFYDILRNHSYATSNMVGSCLYYSVEMGIPFSIYGNKQKFINRGDPNVTMGEYDPYEKSPSVKRLYEMFYGLRTVITKEQRDIVETDLGLRDGISRSKMAYVLYSSLLKWIFSPASIRFVSPLIKESINRRFSGNNQGSGIPV